MNTVSRAIWTYLGSFVFVAVVGVALVLLSGRPIIKSVEFATLDHAAFDGVLPQEPLTLYSTEWNIYQTIFREPFETAVFLFKDGTVLTYSTHESNRVGVSPGLIVENISKAGKTMAECLRVVHNHFAAGSFTDADKATYAYLKAKGFKGIYGIYHTSSGLFESLD